MTITTHTERIGTVLLAAASLLAGARVEAQEVTADAQAHVAGLVVALAA